MLENNRRESKKLKQSTCSKIKIRRKQNYHLETGGLGKNRKKRRKSSHKNKLKETEKKSAFLKNLPGKLNLSNINNAKFQSQDSPPLLQQEQKQGHEHGGEALRGTSSSQCCIWQSSLCQVRPKSPQISCNLLASVLRNKQIPLSPSPQPAYKAQGPSQEAAAQWPRSTCVKAKAQSWPWKGVRRARRLLLHGYCPSPSQVTGQANYMAKQKHELENAAWLFLGTTGPNKEVKV